MGPREPKREYVEIYLYLRNCQGKRICQDVICCPRPKDHYLVETWSEYVIVLSVQNDEDQDDGEHETKVGALECGQKFVR
jgi:hypothetical protein